MLEVTVVLLILGVWWLVQSRAQAILRRWAEGAGFQIVDFQRKHLLGTGPFKWFSNGEGQVVYHVRVRDGTGNERFGWVRCGSYLGGVLFSNQAEVRWDEKRN